MTDHFSFTDGQTATLDIARKFTADRIALFAAQWDEDCQYSVEVEGRGRTRLQSDQCFYHRQRGAENSSW